jgi:hypothetical protein
VSRRISMIAALRQGKARDWRFAGLIALDLLCIGLYLAAGGPEGGQGTGGWRRIDTAAVQRRIDSGDLAGREALWYRPGGQGEPRAGGEER